MTTTASATGLDLICEQIEQCGIKCVTSLPDDWFLPLLQRVDQMTGVKHIRVAREPDAVGVAAGAFFAGTPTMALMGIAGMLTCFHEFVTFNLMYQMPLFILASRRGGMDDPRTYQMGQGTVGIPALEALTIHHDTIDRVEDLPKIQQIYTRCRLLKRPHVCFVTKQVLNYGKESRR